MRKHGIWSLVIGFWAAALASGCQPSVGVACGPGWCSEVEICVDPDSVQSACVRRTCGNNQLDNGEECDDGNNSGGDGCSRNCLEEKCGNHVVDFNEECDEGDAVGGDGCSEKCTLEVCGNGTVDRSAGEQCDDGNTADGDGCTAGCKLPSCGNGVVDPYEQCDDGHLIDGDGCSANCTLEVCGNGIIDRAHGEGCDDGNTTDGDGCTADCKLPMCGNGAVDPYEQCDDGNTADGDNCSASCTIEKCDNRILDRARGEQCDDGNRRDGDGCTAGCELPSCGNGILDLPYEQCDDGNDSSGDGCSAGCTIEACGNGIVDREHGESCDDGNRIDGDGCTADCHLPSCGNGSVDRPYEQCDDGNRDDGDGCSANCTNEICGNGILDVGEECDDGNHRNGDGCSQRCTFEFCGDGVVGRREDCDPRATPETCNLDCTLSQCGDGKVNRFAVPAELCDDGNDVDGDGCSHQCQFERCGNGFLDPFEQCDAGVESAPTGLSDQPCNVRTCLFEVCGNGILDNDSTTGVHEQCDDGNREDGDGCSAACMLERDIGLLAYLKASNTDGNDKFGGSVALSADGLTLVVGAPQESSAATGIGGDQVNNDMPFAGAVYVFTRSGTTWRQQAYIKASNSHRSDQFGDSVALSADGSTLAVGAIGESSAATGVGGDQADRSAGFSGAVYVFTRSGATWTQQAYVKASNTNGGDLFGGSVALSADGSTLAVGADAESSAASGVGGDQANNDALQAGAVYVFARSGVRWSQQAYVKASNAGFNDLFGGSVVLSADGATLAVGAPGESSAATGVDGDQADDRALQAGAVYVFTRSGVTWRQQAYLKASNTSAADVFGASVALSADSATLAVGAVFEASAAKGIDGDQSDNRALQAGAAYVFTRDGATWRQQAYVKASNTDAGDMFGQSVALSADGASLAIGARQEASAATGIGGDETDNSAPSAGAVYMFKRSGVTWSQRALVKASNTNRDDLFGWSIALSADGSVLAACATGESSAATGIGGNQSDDSAASAGAVYVLY